MSLFQFVPRSQSTVSFQFQCNYFTKRNSLPRSHHRRSTLFIYLFTFLSVCFVKVKMELQDLIKTWSQTGPNFVPSHVNLISFIYELFICERGPTTLS